MLLPLNHVCTNTRLPCVHPSVPTPHLLCAGHYAHSLGHYSAACTHFKAVLASDAAPLHDTALLAAALSELQVWGREQPSGRWLAVVGTKPVAGLPCTCSWRWLDQHSFSCPPGSKVFNPCMSNMLRSTPQHRRRMLGRRG